MCSGSKARVPGRSGSSSKDLEHQGAARPECEAWEPEGCEALGLWQKRSGSEARKAAQQRRAWQKRSGSEPRIPGLIRGRIWQNQAGSGSEARKPGPRGKMYEQPNGHNEAKKLALPAGHGRNAAAVRLGSLQPCQVNRP